MSDFNDNDNDDDVFTIGGGVYQSGHTSLFARISDAWKDMPTSTRRMIAENPSESRLLFFVLMSDLIFFLSWSMKTVVSPTSLVESVMPNDIALLLVVGLLGRTTVIYIFSFVLGLILKLFGGTGSLKDTRTGIFWGSFVAAPFAIMSALMAMGMGALEGTMPFLSNPTIALIPLWIEVLPYVWFISAGASAAHGFKRFFPLFGILSLLSVVAMFVAIYLRANGVF